jgi:hypothetical protein
MPGTLTPEDLKAAVDAGVIDATQAEKLSAMRTTASGWPSADANGALADEERFRFLNGFNDVFLTIGVLLVAGAFLSAAAPGFSGAGWLGVVAFAALTFWVLSEILVRRLRAVLPGMVLAVLFVLFAAAAIVIKYHSVVYATANGDLYSELTFWNHPTLLFAAPALVASIVYYLRFRLPFALALIAIFSYFVVSRGLIEYFASTNDVAAPASISTQFVAFAFGLAILAAAMAYDARDLKRTTRLSDCAFWLHLVAAWLIVSPVIHVVNGATADSATTSIIVLAVVFALGLFALAIDRRALLVSSLLYFTFAVYRLLSGTTAGCMPGCDAGALSGSLVTTLALVGAFVLVLGVFWHPLRNRLLPLFQNTALSSYLPPARQ